MIVLLFTRLACKVCEKGAILMRQPQSAKLPEGVFHEMINIFANTLKILMYFRLRYGDKFPHRHEIFDCGGVFLVEMGRKMKKI